MPFELETPILGKGRKVALPKVGKIWYMNPYGFPADRTGDFRHPASFGMGAEIGEMDYAGTYSYKGNRNV